MSNNQVKERDADFSKLDEDLDPKAADSSAAESSIEGDGEDDLALDGDEDSAASSKELEALRAEALDYKDKYLRALAETENVRKRAIKERSDLIKYQGDRVFVDILEIVDNFERALADKDSNVEKLREGVGLIHKLLVDTLNRWEVRGESALGKIFDPKSHKALSQVPMPDKEPGTVIAEMKKPYYYKDKLLRVGEVVVSAAVSKAEEGSEDAENKEAEDE